MTPDATAFVAFLIGLAVITLAIIFATWGGDASLVGSFPIALPVPTPSGEILKVYANGSALLDNGTMMRLSDIPGWCR